MRRCLVAGNWKMNTTRDEAVELAGALSERFEEPGEVDVMVAPPFPWLDTIASVLADSAVSLGAQNAWHEPPGAFTGEVSLQMVREVGCEWVILGHSERRHVIGESNQLVREKVDAALSSGLQVILCVGETLEEREAGETETVLDEQLAGSLDLIDADRLESLVLAYEPVWAIGTGLTATPDQAESAHAHLRKQLASRYNPGVGDATRILYGGSVKPENAAELIGQVDVDGALVGGASLSVESFIGIIEAV